MKTKNFWLDMDHCKFKNMIREIFDHSYGDDWEIDSQSEEEEEYAECIVCRKRK